MHSRDFAALVLAALAAHLALSHDGGVALRKAWVLPTPPDDVAAVGGASYVPPAPVVVRVERGKEGGRTQRSIPHCTPISPPFPSQFDLNGDGRPEIVAATPRGELVVRKDGEGGRGGSL